MPNPNAIVDKISAITPTLRTPADEFLKTVPGGMWIKLAGGQTAKLDAADPRAGIYAEILDELRDMGTPVYLEVDPATQAISRLLIPLTVRVAAVTAMESGELDVELEISSSRHLLRPDNPDFQQLVKALRDAQSSRASVIVTETDEHEIIDVRKALNRYASPALVAPSPLPTVPLGAVSPDQARKWFNLVNDQSCTPRTAPPPCIPFLYPDDGCWGRAHRMCQLMIADRAQPAKVWIYGKLLVRTRNNPRCQVRWGWHVAPTLEVNVGGKTERHVIDPSLFDAPVSENAWKEVQGDPHASLVQTDASIFLRSSGGETETDSDYKKTEEVLRYYRLKLKERSASDYGPPPYAHCS
jgi:hypothetical protein